MQTRGFHAFFTEEFRAFLNSFQNRHAAEINGRWRVSANAK
jgi:hypothetical protein